MFLHFLTIFHAQVMRQIDPGNTKLVYVTYHVDVGETPFLIAVDYAMSAIVVSIRGTLSLTVSLGFKPLKFLS